MNLIKNFIAGKIPLWQSFWIGGIGGLIFLAFIYVFVGVSLEELVGFIPAKLITFIINFVLFVLILLGVFRSSNNYSGSKWWSILAKIFFSFSLCVFLINTVRPILLISTLFGLHPKLIQPLIFFPSIIIIIIFCRLKPKN